MKKYEFVVKIEVLATDIYWAKKKLSEAIKENEAVSIIDIEGGIKDDNRKGK